MNLLKDNRVDAVVGDEPVISYFMQQLNMKDGYKMLDRPLYEKECVLALPKEERTLLNIINKGIYNLKKKDTMVKIQQKWFGISRPIVKDKATQRFMLIIAFFTVIISMASYLFTVWNKELKNQVEKRTRELDRSKKDLEITFDGLPHFMVVLDDNCNIVSTNKSFCEFEKQYKYEIIGKSCMHFNGIVNMDCNDCIVKRSFLDGQHNSKEITFKEKLYEINTFHLDDDTNSKQRVLVMIRDITKIRISEQQLLQSNKMAAVGQLAAGVAHEIRNPLGVIRNYCYVLKNNINQGLDDKAKPIVVIEKSVKKIAGIIDNLLNFSRITDEGVADIELETFIRNVLELNSKLMDRKNIKTELICSEKMYLHFNEEALKHVLINLISNAVDAMPEGGYSL